MTAALILDFDGVCTKSSGELIASQIHGRDSGDASTSRQLSEVIRPEAVHAMATAQAIGLTTVILSNELERAWLVGLELTDVTDHTIIGSDNGIFKPDRRAFQRCLLVTGCRANQTLLVDDNLDNIAVADSLGMRTVHFDTQSAASRANCWTDVHHTIDNLRVRSTNSQEPPNGQ